jgi:hypothetical protein
MKRTPCWPFLIVAGFIALAEGPLNLFWIWNTFPVALGYALLRRAQRNEYRTAPEMGFIALSCGLLICGHLANLLDRNSGSSTACLIFIFLPVYAVLLGGLGFGVLRLFTPRDFS